MSLELFLLALLAQPLVIAWGLGLLFRLTGDFHD